MNAARAECSLSTVVGDSPCRDCAYNLRTLAWEGVCPECGLPVRASRLPKHLRFGSFRSIRRTRLGIAFCVVAMLLPALSETAFTIATLCSESLYRNPSAQYGLVGWLYWGTWLMWNYSNAVAGAVGFVGILLIVAPLAPLRDQFKPRLAWLVAGFALLGLVTSLFYAAASGIGALASVPLWFWFVLWGVIVVFTTLTPVLTWVHGAARLAPSAGRRTRLVIHVGVTVVILLALGILMDAGVTLASMFAWTPPMIATPDFEWWTQLDVIRDVVRRYAGAIGQILLLLVLWFCVRTLDAALRPERHRRGRRPVGDVFSTTPNAR